MIITVLLNKLKSFILIFVNLFRRALCCLRRRRRSSSDTVPLTHVVSSTEETKEEFQNWGDWEDTAVNSKPKTVQDHIELYRKQAELAKRKQESPDPDEQLNFFEDMTPRITKQTKLYVSADHGDSKQSLNRLNFVEDSLDVVPSAELTEWEETSGWEGETLDHDAQKALREKKRQEREKRAWEQNQKRQERMSRSLGSKLSA